MMFEKILMISETALKHSGQSILKAVASGENIDYIEQYCTKCSELAVLDAI